jgi:hypothetical protein
MNELERAEEHLKTIRRMMERATIYRAISAPTACVGGILSLIAFAVYVKWFNHFGPSDFIGSDENYFLRLWLAVLVLTAAANTLFIVAGAKKRGEPVFSPSMKAAFTALAPAFIAGGFFTFYFAGTGWVPIIDVWLSIGWCVFYGLGLLATSHFAPRSLTLLGWAFLVTGLAVFAVYRFTSGMTSVFNADFTMRPVGAGIMALTFGLFHIIYAFCAWPRKGAAPEL